MATIYVENKPYQAAEGQNLLQACLSLGFDLPYFCWHPAMHSVGACRQCAVKLFKNEQDSRGKIVMSCMTPVTDGLRLSIADPEAREFRKGVVEFLMVNHPHDCPICDEGGECHLQDMTVMTGHTYRRFRFKKRTHRNQDLGPFVNHEMNRCIVCWRCLRFYRDYAGGRDFDAFAWHNLVYFGRHQDGPLESELSGNLVEVCPTGVFTDKTLKKHYTRKWDLQTAPSVCVHCSLGCNTIVGERYGTVRRILNRFNASVNGYFLCDRGRFGYEFVNSERRLRRPLLRHEGKGEQEAVDGSEALLHLATVLGEPGRAIGIGSPRASLESNFALRTLVGPQGFFSGTSDTDGRLTTLALDILRRGPARAPALQEMAKADAVLILGEDVSQTAPLMPLALRQAILTKPLATAAKLGIPRWDDAACREAIQNEKSPLFLATPGPTKLDRLAAGVYRAAPEELARLGFAVAHAISGDAPAVADLSDEMRLRAEAIAAALKAAESPLVISGTSCGSDALIQAAANVAWALCRHGRPAGLSFIFPECNSLGLALLGGTPLGAAAKALQDGLTDTVIVLENDLYRRAEADVVEKLFGAAKHVIVLDHLANATTARAEVVLPAATFAEASGSLVNNEGRAQRFYRAFVPQSEVRESWQWLRDIMTAAGRSEATRWQTLDDVTAAMGEVLPVFAAVRDIAPPEGFRVAGSKIPRQPHRYSGRTAMTANCDVNEPQAPSDSDSALAFSMEGYEGQPPPALAARYWAPAWNSVQALNKFQAEVGGPLRGGNPGRRLIEPMSGGPSADFHVPLQKFKPRPGELLLVPAWHCFGSEELSAQSPGVASLSPSPYCGLSVADAGALGVKDGDEVELILAAAPGTAANDAAVAPGLRLPVKVIDGLAAGVAEVFAGTAGPAFLAWPAWAKVVRVASQGGRASA